MIRWTTILILVSAFAHGQDLKINSGSDQLIQLRDDFKLISPQNFNQYISDHWARGILYYANGNEKEYDSLNFDRFSGLVEVVINNKPLSLMAMGFEGALIFNSPTTGYVLLSARLDDKKSTVVVQSSGKYVLAATVQVTETITTTFVNTDEIRFVAKPKSELSFKKNYYLWKDKKWQNFKLSKSSIAKLFSIGKKELKTYSATNNLNLMNDIDLVELFDYFN